MARMGTLELRLTGKATVTNFIKRNPRNALREMTVEIYN